MHAGAEVLVAHAHVGVDSVENRAFDEGIEDDGPRSVNGQKQGGVKCKGTPVETDGIGPLHQRKAALAESMDEVLGQLAPITSIEFTFEGLKLRSFFFLSCGVVDVEVQKKFPSKVVSPGEREVFLA